jgi:TolA-binding protein
MDAVTYPEPKVAEFLNSRIIPVRLAFNSQPYAAQYEVKWTPTLITLDADGKEYHRTVGFLSPEALIPSLLLGMAKVFFNGDRFSEALDLFDQLLAGYPKSPSAPEAIYLQGVSRYKSTHDPKPLKGAYEKLQADYPSSEWTQRAYPYRLL